MCVSSRLVISLLLNPQSQRPDIILSYMSIVDHITIFPFSQTHSFSLFSLNRITFSSPSVRQTKILATKCNLMFLRLWRSLVKFTISKNALKRNHITRKKEFVVFGRENMTINHLMVALIPKMSVFDSICGISYIQTFGMCVNLWILCRKKLKWHEPRSFSFFIGFGCTFHAQVQRERFPIQMDDWDWKLRQP